MWNSTVETRLQSRPKTKSFGISNFGKVWRGSAERCNIFQKLEVTVWRRRGFLGNFWRCEIWWGDVATAAFPPRRMQWNESWERNIISQYEDMVYLQTFGIYWKGRSLYINMDVSKNSGTPKSSILIGFSIINHPFWGFSLLFLETPIYIDSILPQFVSLSLSTCQPVMLCGACNPDRNLRRCFTDRSFPHEWVSYLRCNLDVLKDPSFFQVQWQWKYNKLQ